MGSKATKAKPKERLRPGQLDGLVLGYMKRQDGELPITAAKVARGIKRSSGAWATASNGSRRRRKCGGSAGSRAATTWLATRNSDRLKTKRPPAALSGPRPDAERAGATERLTPRGPLVAPAARSPEGQEAGDGR